MEGMNHITKTNDRKNIALLVGAVVGLLTGLGAAYLLIQRAEREGTLPALSAGEGVKVGLLVLGMLRQVAQFGKE